MSIASPDTHDDKPGAKIILRSDLGESVAVETPWAFELGDGHYRLDNVPWWAAEYSLDDVVRCEEDEDEQPLAVEVAEPSGHRTARVLFSPLSRPEVQAEVLADLDRAGAGYEGTGRDRHGFYAVDVPPGVEVAGALEGEALEWQLPGESAFLARCYRAYTTDNFTVAHEGGELMVDIENGRWERLAAEPAGEGRWRVASIPLFAYHVFPGDVVEASARPGEYPVLTRAVERSGRWVLRAIVADGGDEDALAAECARLGGEIGRHPWEGLSMFAVAVDGDDAARAMEAHLAEREQEGALSYETGW